MSWTTFLEDAPPADHGVQVYSELEELATSVGRFLAAGFQAREPAIVIAVPEHWRVFREELARRGHDADELQARGLLICRDAEETLDAVMDEAAPSADRFDEIVGGLVDEVAARFPDRTVRAFGEMVDLLHRRGQESAAAALEDLWNSLLRTRRLALLCAYELDVFDLAVQTTALPAIVRAHTHPRPVADPGRLAAAVDRTLAEVVGPGAAAQVYLRVAEDVPRTQLPRAQAVLMWLSRHEPATARRVLNGARARYSRAA